MVVDDPGEDVSQVFERVDVVEFAGLDERSDGGPVFGAAIRSREQRIFPVERDGADGAFDGIVVELDTAIVDEARQTFPARQGVPDCFGELALLADQTKFCAQPWFKGIDKRLTFLLPDGATFIGAAATDVFLDGIERGNVFERFAGNRRRTGSCQFIEAPPYM